MRYNENVKRYLLLKILVFFVASSLAFATMSVPSALADHTGSGAELFIEPTSGGAIVGETFQASVYLDTNDHTINTIDVKIKFPADRLQVVSPSVGRSIIGIWTAPPSFNNTTGELHFQGGIPSPGINISKGLISTITFRVRSVGTANLSFLGDSKVLLNDGLGTDILTNTTGSSVRLTLPLPQGPIVTSPTHPNQEEWYKSKTATLQWETEFGGIQGYSYVVNSTPVDDPDDISEGLEEEISYKNLPDGFHYFHIKALRNGNWGGTTHFAIKIDSTPPAEFNIDILPEQKTTSKFPIINFETTDAHSGISHYELRIVPLTKGVDEALEQTNDGFFIEAQTRYIAQVDLGEYDVLVRAYDNAGNYRESAEKLEVITPLLTFSRSGVGVLSKFTIPWWLVILIGLILIALLAYLSRASIKLHQKAHADRTEGALNDPVIKRRLEELQRQRQKYTGASHKMAAFFLLISLTGLYSGWIGTVKAQEIISLPPPIITTVPLDIANDQLFYVGGQTDVVDSEVIIFLQNVQDGQVTSQSVMSDKKGDWFYAFRDPLMSGTYLLWAQGKVGSQFSPPSPQKEISVSKTAFQLGASRLSFETLYLFITIILFGAVVLLGSYTGYHLLHGRRKRKDLMREVEEADTVIKEGFKTLHEDISRELDVIHRAKLSKALSAQEEERERKMLEDLAEIEKFVNKEFHDVKLRSRKI